MKRFWCGLVLAALTAAPGTGWADVEAVYMSLSGGGNFRSDAAIRGRLDAPTKQIADQQTKQKVRPTDLNHVGKPPSGGRHMLARHKQPGYAMDDWNKYGCGQGNSSSARL